jgi:hypothetical protein
MDTVNGFRGDFARTYESGKNVVGIVCDWGHSAMSGLRIAYDTVRETMKSGYQVGQAGYSMISDLISDKGLDPSYARVLEVCPTVLSGSIRS